jgi:hypothetical protein
VLAAANAAIVKYKSIPHLVAWGKWKNPIWGNEVIAEEVDGIKVKSYLLKEEMVTKENMYI